MVREMKSILNWGEVAPTLLISHSRSRRYTNSFKKLEPIEEEHAQHGFKILYKGLISFPLLISGFLYIFLYRGLF
ncbi:hypothetical protein Lalb_Chr07g0187541 [Lupinus albus]|uniref:Uncharacterized protein n=1 Tax=Lupinus albus TaxID=3870 RepID=A0A6A4QAJ2_LUPAL|nr:hypothetical protein Lalb_Chr07g0187541 [Lupinus albus]